MIESPLSRRPFRECSLRYVNLSLYSISLHCLTSFVALLCTFSMAIDCLFKYGYQIILPYSRCGLTRALYSCRNISLSMCINVLFIRPIVLFALLIAFCMCGSNGSFWSKVLPRTCSSLQQSIFWLASS